MKMNWRRVPEEKCSNRVPPPGAFRMRFRPEVAKFFVEGPNQKLHVFCRAGKRSCYIPVWKQIILKVFELNKNGYIRTVRFIIDTHQINATYKLNGY
jgi:hypothetical protein